jgi:DNA-binding transcriptional regulator/RsmH inhibitor MraZ
LVKPNIWVKDILEHEGERVYTDWKKKQESLSYTFKSDLKLLDDSYQANFVSHDGQHPIVMTTYLRKQISLETFTLLVHFANIFDYWDKKLVDKIVSRDIIRTARKYRPFLVIDEKKFKDIVREHFG